MTTRINTPSPALNTQKTIKKPATTQTIAPLKLSQDSVSFTGKESPKSFLTTITDFFTNIFKAISNFISSLFGDNKNTSSQKADKQPPLEPDSSTTKPPANNNSAVPAPNDLKTPTSAETAQKLETELTDQIKKPDQHEKYKAIRELERIATNYPEHCPKIIHILAQNIEYLDLYQSSTLYTALTLLVNIKQSHPEYKDEILNVVNNFSPIPKNWYDIISSSIEATKNLEEDPLFSEILKTFSQEYTVQDTDLTEVKTILAGDREWKDKLNRVAIELGTTFNLEDLINHF